jgi:hypothetical protein
MSEGHAETDWLTHNNFRCLCDINDIPMESFEEFKFYLNKILSKHSYFDNDSDMSMDDSFISFDCDSSDYMEDENEEYCIFQSIGRKMCIVGHIGSRISPICGYIYDYPEGVIPDFLNILKLFFPGLKFIENRGLIEIWNMNTNSMTCIQHLFLIIRNIKNPEFNFKKWVDTGGVEDRKENKENEFSIATKKLIWENANHCCESCGLRLLKPAYCKKYGEKILDYSKYYPKDQKLYGYIDHINEHRFGGSNDIENGQLLCHVCHSKKTNMFSKSRAFYQKIKNKYSVVSLQSSIKKISKRK